jgi:hypothetical protein
LLKVSVPIDAPEAGAALTGTARATKPATGAAASPPPSPDHRTSVTDAWGKAVTKITGAPSATPSTCDSPKLVAEVAVELEADGGVGVSVSGA